MNPRTPWLLFYVLVNIVAAYIMLNSGKLIGDTAGIELYSQSALLCATVLVVLSYLLILGPIFNFFSKLKIQCMKFGGREFEVGGRIGKLLIFLQIVFMIFNLSTGVNTAGANSAKTDNPLAMVFVLVPIDTLFFIYYGFYRDNKYFYPNLFIWIISNLSRGWAGIFLFIIFFEWCRVIRNKTITAKRSALIGVLVLVLYPLLSNIKWLIRASAATGMSLKAIADGFINNIEWHNFIELIGDGVIHIVARLQVTSLVVEVMRLSSQLQDAFTDAKFAPFWMEGLHGIFFDRLFLGEKKLWIGVAFTQLGDFGVNFDTGDWNTNIGYVGWFFIAPYLAPVYITYTLFLGLSSFYLVKKIGISDSSKDMLWLAWLVFLMPPWLALFVGFVYTLFVFLIIKFILTRLPTFRLLPGVKY